MDNISSLRGELERDYIKMSLKKLGWSQEIVDLAEIEITDNAITIFWKADVSDNVRSKFLLDVENEAGRCWSCETILEDTIERLLNGEEVRLDEETIGLCEDYWKWLLEKILRFSNSEKTKKRSRK